jgi:NADH:ubiquinone oxidoreductase subunit 4 (subunit M)
MIVYLKKKLLFIVINPGEKREIRLFPFFFLLKSWGRERRNAGTPTFYYSPIILFCFLVSPFDISNPTVDIETLERPFSLFSLFSLVPGPL